MWGCGASQRHLSPVSATRNSITPNKTASKTSGSDFAALWLPLLAGSQGKQSPGGGSGRRTFGACVRRRSRRRAMRSRVRTRHTCTRLHHCTCPCSCWCLAHLLQVSARANRGGARAAVPTLPPLAVRGAIRPFPVSFGRCRAAALSAWCASPSPGPGRVRSPCFAVKLCLLLLALALGSAAGERQGGPGALGQGGTWHHSSAA